MYAQLPTHSEPLEEGRRRGGGGGGGHNQEVQNQNAHQRFGVKVFVVLQFVHMLNRCCYFSLCYY